MKIRPERERRQFWSNIGLAVTTGILLGIAYPPSPFSSTAYVALVPFLVLLERQTKMRQVLGYTYVSMFVFHLLTIYWVGGFVHGNDSYMMISGAVLLLVHPVFYWLVTAPYYFIRQRLGPIPGLAAFILLWVAYEYSHALSEFSFPWLTIGNSQAYDIMRIQIAEFTSVYGISFLLLLFNVVTFVLLMQLASRDWNWKTRETFFTLGFLVVLYLAPAVYGRSVLTHRELSDTGRPLRVGVVQPNIDPWEKWGEGRASKWESFERQMAIHLAETRKLAEEPRDLVVWPETAIPYEILSPNFRFNWQNLKLELDAIGVPVFTGFPDSEYFDSTNVPVTAVRIRNSDVYVDYYNAAMLILPHREVEKVYRKSVLVPFAERVPYAETFSFLIEPLKWSVGISGWGRGEEQTVFMLPRASGDSVGLAGMICYESVYPNYVRGFVNAGAELLLIITNDSWWGNTSGAYQHAAYASFRAIETRRWIVRCANGGISAFIDPVGRMHQTTTLYTATTISGEVTPRSEKTFYVLHGDVFAQVCSLGALLMVVIAGVVGRRPDRE